MMRKSMVSTAMFLLVCLLGEVGYVGGQSPVARDRQAGGLPPLQSRTLYALIDFKQFGTFPLEPECARWRTDNPAEEPPRGCEKPQTVELDAISATSPAALFDENFDQLPNDEDGRYNDDCVTAIDVDLVTRPQSNNSPPWQVTVVSDQLHPRMLHHWSYYYRGKAHGRWISTKERIFSEDAEIMEESLPMGHEIIDIALPDGYGYHMTGAFVQQDGIGGHHLHYFGERDMGFKLNYRTGGTTPENRPPLVYLRNVVRYYPNCSQLRAAGLIKNTQFIYEQEDYCPPGSATVDPKGGWSANRTEHVTCTWPPQDRGASSCGSRVSTRSLGDYRPVAVFPHMHDHTISTSFYISNTSPDPDTTPVHTFAATLTAQGAWHIDHSGVCLPWPVNTWHVHDRAVLPPNIEGGSERSQAEWYSLSDPAQHLLSKSPGLAMWTFPSDFEPINEHTWIWMKSEELNSHGRFTDPERRVATTVDAMNGLRLWAEPIPPKR